MYLVLLQRGEEDGSHWFCLYLTYRPTHAEPREREVLHSLSHCS